MADQDLRRGIATGIGLAKAGGAAYGLAQGAGAGATASGAGALLSALAAATGNEELAESARLVGLTTSAGGAVGAFGPGASLGAGSAALPVAAAAPVIMGAINLATHLGTRSAKEFARKQAERKTDSALGAQANEILRRLADADVSKLDPDLVARGYARGAAIAGMSTRYGGTRSDIDRHMEQLGLRGGDANEAAYGGLEQNRGYLSTLLANEAKVVNKMRQAADSAVTSGRYTPPDMTPYTERPGVGRYAEGTNPYDIIVHQAALQVNPRLTELGLDPKKQGVKERVQFEPVDLSGAYSADPEALKNPEFKASWIETLRGQGNLGWARVQPDGSLARPSAPAGQLPIQNTDTGGP